MTSPATPPLVPDTAVPGDLAHLPRPTTSLRRLLVMLLVATLGWSLPNTAAATLAQALVAEWSPDDKVRLFAVVSTVGAVAAMIATVTAGALSDRTRSPFGRRTPWILGGAAVAVPGLLLAGTTTAFVVLVIGYALFQGAMNASIAALNAVTPDRVPRERLGLASAVSGLGYLLGLVIGTTVAAALIETPGRGLVLVPWVLLGGALLFVIIAPDRSSRTEPAPTTSWRALLPPRDRDFLLAFLGRFLTLFALLLFSVYSLYICTDYLHLSTIRAGEVIALGMLLLAVTAIASTVTGGLVSDRIGRRKPIVAGASLLMALGALPVVVAPSVGTLLLFTALAGVGYGAYLSVDAALMVEVLPSGMDLGKDLGFLTLANTAPVVLAPGAAAVVVSISGYPALFVALIVSAVLGGACILAIRKVR